MTLRTILIFLILGIFCLNASAESRQPDFRSGVGISAEQEFFPFVAEAASDKVNVRAGQSSDFEKLYLMSKGEEVVVLDKLYSWYKINLPEDASSFIFAQYVKKIGEGLGEITGSRVNVRARNRVNASVLGQLKKGDTVVIAEDLGEWFRIEPLKDSSGWVLDKFLVFKSKNVLAFNEKLIAEKEAAAREKIVKIKKADPVPVKKNDPVKNEVVLKLTKEISPVKNEVVSKKAVELMNVKKEAAEPENLISLKGTLVKNKDESLKGVQYRLDVDGKNEYLIEGFKYVFDEFLNYKVEVKGLISEGSKKTSKAQVLDVSRIQLVL